MPTAQKIITSYKKLHDELSAAFYKKKRAGKVTAAEQADFDTKHRKIWVDMQAELEAAGLASPLPQDFESKVAELEARVMSLESGG